MTCKVTYEELSAYSAGDLDAARRAEIDRHAAACRRCRDRLAALAEADAALRALPPHRPPAAAVLATWRALAARAGPPEIMKLDEVAEFLRITPAQLDEIAEALPAFELAGQVRVRRARLMEWVQRRERAYARQAAASWAGRLKARTPDRGVA